MKNKVWQEIFRRNDISICEWHFKLLSNIFYWKGRWLWNKVKGYQDWELEEQQIQQNFFLNFARFNLFYTSLSIYHDQGRVFGSLEVIIFITNVDSWTTNYPSAKFLWDKMMIGTSHHPNWIVSFLLNFSPVIGQYNNTTT